MKRKKKIKQFQRIKEYKKSIIISLIIKIHRIIKAESVAAKLAEKAWIARLQLVHLS